MYKRTCSNWNGVQAEKGEEWKRKEKALIDMFNSVKMLCTCML